MKINRVLLTLILILSFQTPAFPADANNSFTGTWALDLNASDSLDGLMKAQGRSRLERRFARGMAVTQTITQDKTQLHIHMKSKAIDSQSSFPLDSQWHPLETPNMGTVKARSEWLDGPLVPTIQTYMQVTIQNQPADFSVVRNLENNGQTMILNTTLTLADGTKEQARRVFQRQ